MHVNQDPRNIRIEEYDYPLPSGRIAQFPVSERDQSKLLIYQDSQVSEDRFCNIANYLPENSLILFNETRVIRARLLFYKPSGSRIEIFCLEPVNPAEVQTAFEKRETCIWKCLIGNAKRWKSGDLTLITDLNSSTLELKAEKAGVQDDAFLVRFTWTPAHYSFSEVLETLGKTPLPPYISRESSEEDKLRYQTLYARQEGSVAAPTAGLHFSHAVMERLAEKNIEMAKITLHVGAGTFRPVSSDFLSGHLMHTEKVSVPIELIRKLRDARERKIILVGTTTVRAVESIYWQGVKWLHEPVSHPMMEVKQWDPYRQSRYQSIPVEKALDKVLEVLQEHKRLSLEGSTSLMIAPGYSYKFPDIVITNFHQPKSTLLLLVSAFVGEGWKEAYAYALDNDFRFLSYGDSCLFFRKSG